MIKNPDMVLLTTNGADPVKPNWYKVFLMLNKKGVISQHQCIYEGKAGFEKLEEHLIVSQITIRDGKHYGVENTPGVKSANYLQPREELLISNKLWRYISFSKFSDLINNSSIYFSRIDKFFDNLEGVSPESCINTIMNDDDKTPEQKKENVELYKIRMENNRKNSYACCWHINKRINYDMWEEYGKTNDSIALQTDVNILSNIFEPSGIPVICEPVRYFENPYFNQNAYWFPTLFKTKDFSHEQEFRTIMFVNGLDLNGLKIKINLAELIKCIYVHPDASQEFFKKTMDLVNSQKLSIPIIQPCDKNN